MDLSSATPLNESKFSGEQTTVTTSSLNTIGSKRKHKNADDDRIKSTLSRKEILGAGRRRMGTSCKQHDQHELERVMKLLKSFKSYPMGKRTLKVRR